MAKVNGFTLEQRLHLALKASRLGREVLLSYAGKLQSVEKKYLAGWVSEADKKSEQVIFQFLKQYFPQEILLGEESAQDVSALPASTEGRWILDPLDGTTNYIHGFPAYAVSLGFEYRGEILVGVVDLPALGDVYCAAKGMGAWVNGVSLSVSKTQKLDESLLATGFFGEIESQLQDQIRIFSKIVGISRGIRRAGAAAYDLCLVARGVFDAYWEKGLQPWDVAAGQLIVNEAGGVLTTYEGQAFQTFDTSLVAGNPKIVPQILEFTKSKP